jgi:hypothetical protein
LRLPYLPAFVIRPAPERARCRRMRFHVFNCQRSSGFQGPPGFEKDPRLASPAVIARFPSEPGYRSLRIRFVNPADEVFFGSFFRYVFAACSGYFPIEKAANLRAPIRIVNPVSRIFSDPFSRPLSALSRPTGRVERSVILVPRSALSTPPSGGFRESSPHRHRP